MPGGENKKATFSGSRVSVFAIPTPALPGSGSQVDDSLVALSARHFLAPCGSFNC